VSGQLGFGCVKDESIDHGDAVFTRQLGKDRAQTGTIHFLVDLLREVLVGRIRECTATSTPDGRGSHTRTGAAGAFLAPWLLGAVLDSIATLLGTVAAAGIGLESNNDLVHKRFVEVATENGVGCGYRSGRLTLVIQELEFHD